jgi:cell division transport system ATP-binding protein
MAQTYPIEHSVPQIGLIVRFEGLWTGYDGPDVLRDVGFQVAAGEVAVLSGPTAAGKTSLLHVMRLALPPRQGEASVLGEDIMRLSERRRARLKRQVGYIGEEPTFVEDWSVFDNVALPLRVAKRKPADYGPDVRELLTFVGLEDAANEPAGHLSFAERRRVAIARALAGKPDLILADEPGAGLNLDGAMRIFRLIAEMRRIGAGIVIATQSPEFADGIDATHWHIEAGQVSRGAPQGGYAIDNGYEESDYAAEDEEGEYPDYFSDDDAENYR